MFPTLADLLGGSLGPLGRLGTHDACVAIGVAVAALVFVAEARRRGQIDERLTYVVAGCLVGGAIFMRLGTWWQHVDLRENATLAEQWAYGNRSILGGLVGAWLGVHVAKRLCGYRSRTGDLFAPAVAIGMTLGRVGCLLTEEPGTPTGMPWGIVLDPAAAARVGSPAGVPLHPSFGYEIAFHLVAFGVLIWWARRRVSAPGELFVAYVAAYGVFRFLVEFVRANEIVWGGLSRPQLFLAVSVPIVLARVVVLVRRGAFSRTAAGASELGPARHHDGVPE